MPTIGRQGTEMPETEYDSHDFYERVQLDRTRAEHANNILQTRKNNCTYTVVCMIICRFDTMNETQYFNEKWITDFRMSGAASPFAAHKHIDPNKITTIGEFNIKSGQYVSGISLLARALKSDADDTQISNRDLLDLASDGFIVFSIFGHVVLLDSIVPNGMNRMNVIVHCEKGI